LIIHEIRDIVKLFLRESLEMKDSGEEVRIIGIEHTEGSWVVEAEVAERDLTLPGHRVFEKKRYIVKLNDALEVTAYRQAYSRGEERREYDEGLL
jgi:hypothetical protein